MKRRTLSIALVSLVALVALVAWFNRAELKRCAYEEPGRDAWQQPERVIAALELRPGDDVADIGAGGGYFTFRFAQAVGSTGKVYAVDVDPDMTRYVERRARQLGVRNVETILASPDDPRLPESSVDVIFVCNTYHHIKGRADYFRRIQRSLRPSGCLVVIEYSGRDGWFVRFFGHSTKAETIRAEVEAAGYDVAKQFDFLPRQHFLVFSHRE